jgi:hypothetical protein
MNRYALYWVFICVFASSCKKEPAPPKTTSVYENYSNGAIDSLKINQLSILASHNSYHLKTDSNMFAYLTTIDTVIHLPSADNPEYLDYTHLPLGVQLVNYHIRGLELDVWNDPSGGHYYYRQGYTMMGLPAASNIPALLQPGFKILHIPDFDFNPTNYTFVDALTEIKAWSDAHPNHIPLFINVETEVSAPGDDPRLAQLEYLTKALPFDATAANELDIEIKNVFGPDLAGVITPDQVRGKYSTLEQAVLAGNWPKLGAARGKVMFVIDPDGNSGNVYISGHPSLQGRAMFVYVNPGTPEAAFVKLNDAVGSFQQIQQDVKLGYIIRTMSDDATVEARDGDYSVMNAAFGSWAQIVSTDYYRPDPRAGTPGWSDYHVVLPGGGVARIDSISATNQLSLGAIKE